MSKGTGEKISWQMQKSENTRNAIMEAAINCYIELGYTNTTVVKIAEEAGVSRGAMMHHFDSRTDIINASVNYLAEKRLAEFTALVSGASVDGGKVVSEEVLLFTLNALWDFFHLPSYTAFQELMTAARTDSELSKVMAPAQQEFDTRINNTILAMFPAWAGIDSAREVITDLFWFTLQGAAIGHIGPNHNRRVKNVLKLLANEGLSVFNRSKKQVA